ncbi:hypothetical protein ACWGAN_04465 [Streptomyces sp. NPDC054945]
MLRKILRVLAGDASQRSDTEPDSFSNPPIYRWRCECGAKSRGSDIKADTEYNAQRHQWRHGLSHPMPEVYAAE